MQRGIVLWVLATGLWAGCEGAEVPPAASHVRDGGFSVEPREEVLTEPRHPLAERPLRQVGEDCTEAGASACLSGMCLHARPGRKEGYVCSRGCESQGDCPGGWRCVQVYPTPEGWLCIPPSSWKGTAPESH